MVNNDFKKLWKQRTGKEWQPATLQPTCIHMTNTGKPYIPARPCRGNKIICNNPKCPAEKCELPVNHCKPSTCKYFTPDEAKHSGASQPSTKNKGK